MAEPTGASARMLEELRQAIRARDTFVAIAAHELRNPMTPILMQVHTLLRAAADPKAAVPPAILAGLERLERAVEVYGRRASTLLQVSRINADQLELAPVELDLSRLVMDAIERHEPMAAFVGSRLDAPPSRTELLVCSTRWPSIRSWTTCSPTPSTTVLASRSW